MLSVVLADPLFDLLANPNGELPSVFCFPLRHEPIVVVSTCVALTAEFIEHRDELPFRIDRELECFDGPVMFTSASANHPISARRAAVADARMASYAKLNWVSEDIPLATAF